MEKINVAELLKDCPQGMELDCAVFDNIVFNGSISNCVYPIKVITKDGSKSLNLTKYGCTSENKNAKCIIFPKGKTTWEGFHRPFVDGDIVAYDNPSRSNLQLFIFKDKKENDMLSFCYLMLDGDELDLEEGMYYITRLATEEEKQKLFNAIEAKGYKWNPETKTLEELQKFKDGDIIFTNTNLNNTWISIFKEINSEGVLTYVDYLEDGSDNYSNLYICEDFLCVENDIICQRLATEEEKQKLFDAIKANGYKWNAETKTLEKLVEPKFEVGNIIQDTDSYKVKITEVNIEDECYGYESVIAKGIGGIGFDEQDDWELVPNKFDIDTLEPLQPVLVRNTNGQAWTMDLFSHKIDTNKRLQVSFVCIGWHCPDQCIPYKGNEHLRGTTDDCDDFYKIWK